jgi:hypothetical protein
MPSFFFLQILAALNPHSADFVRSQHHHAASFGTIVCSGLLAPSFFPQILAARNPMPHVAVSSSNLGQIFFRYFMQTPFYSVAF